MKAQRKVCAARASGVRVFPNANQSTVTGCTAHPGHEKKCFIHRNDESPVMEKLSLDLKKKMRRLRSTRSTSLAFLDERDDDEVFIAEAILKREKDNYLVKCVGYEAEWMSIDVIPTFLLEHFHKTGNKKIPLPHILSSTSTGNVVYNTLTWTADNTLPMWTPYADTLFPGHSSVENDDDGVALRCNTKKDKDTRFHRHTAGIFIGCWPCGICVLWDELYGTESISQVHGIITDWLATLSVSARNRLKFALYDDMCHLSRYSRKSKLKNLNEVTECFANLSHAVDFMHFRGHKDVWCKENMNPHHFKELEPVNSQVCEQKFSYTNHFKNCKAMNEEHFKFYWLYILDLKNLLIEKKLGQVANPTRPERQKLIVQTLSTKNKIIKTKDVQSDVNSIIVALESTRLSSDVFCSCTRKCATIACLCKKSQKPCDSNCHPKNTKCQNF